jgi:hypothetical protein
MLILVRARFAGDAAAARASSVKVRSHGGTDAPPAALLPPRWM